MSDYDVQINLQLGEKSPILKRRHVHVLMLPTNQIQKLLACPGRPE